jgi:hypothetical protein
MSKWSNGLWGAPLWAWRGNQDVWTIDEFPHFSFRLGNTQIKDFHTEVRAMYLYPPYCLLHYSWITPEKAIAKTLRYKASCTTGALFPLEFAGKLETLPEWAREQR